MLAFIICLIFFMLQRRSHKSCFWVWVVLFETRYWLTSSLITSSHVFLCLLCKSIKNSRLLTFILCFSIPSWIHFSTSTGYMCHYSRCQEKTDLVVPLKWSPHQKEIPPSRQKPFSLTRSQVFGECIKNAWHDGQSELMESVWYNYL